MWLDNYANPNNIDLKLRIKQMLELKNSVLKLQFKIKHYKKYEPEIKYRKEHELNIKRYEDNLVKAKKEFKKIRIKTKKNYGYDKKSYEKYLKDIENNKKENKILAKINDKVKK